MKKTEKRDERSVSVADHEVLVSRLVEDGQDAGYMLKTVPSGTLRKEFFSSDGDTFFPLTSGILPSGHLHKIVDSAEAISDAGLLSLLRQALAEWKRAMKGQDTDLQNLSHGAG
jgi:hypothetical protein